MDGISLIVFGKPLSPLDPPAVQCSTFSIGGITPYTVTQPNRWVGHTENMMFNV